MYIVVVSVFEFVVKICQRLTKREREREIGYIHPRPFACRLSEHPHQCSVYDRANENWMMKSQNMAIWLCKKVLVQNLFAELAEADKTHSKA
jgi:hypothetical protein